MTCARKKIRDSVEKRWITRKEPSIGFFLSGGSNEMLRFLHEGAHEITVDTRKRPDMEKERCSGSFHLAVRFLVIKDDSISERPG